jgi:hypothetical protein
MIDKALGILADGLRNYLVHIPGLNITSQEPVALKHIVEFDGSLALPDDSVGIFLVNIEEERVMRSQSGYFTGSDGRVSHANPEVKLNLYALVAVNFAKYKTGLEYLSAAIRFFQGKSVFTPDNTPEMDPAIQKLIVEMMTLNFEQQNHLWASLGAKYLPSVLYRIRMLIMQEAMAFDEQPPVSTIHLAAKGS